MADNEITQVDTFVDQLAKGNNAEAGFWKAPHRANF